MKREDRNIKKLSLGMKIFIGFILGISAGILLQYVMGEGAAVFANTYITPFSTLFLNLIKMVCIPLVFFSIVVGAGSTGNAKSMGRIGGKTIGYFLSTTAISIVIALSLANILKLGVGFGLSTENLEYTAKETQGVVATLINIIPTNPIAALASGEMLQIIFFALAIGLGINMVGDEADCVMTFFAAMTDIMCKITGVIMAYAPFAVCAMAISTIAGYGIGVLKQYALVCAVIYVGCLLHILFVYFPTIRIICNYNLKTFLKKSFPSFMLAFTTMSSNAALPVTLENGRDIGIPARINSFVIPLGCTIHMDGTAIYQAILTVFIANVYGMPLTIMQQGQVVLVATLAAIGTAGVPGAGMIMLGTVLVSVGLPIEGIALIMGLLSFVAPICTATNVFGDVVASLFVANSERKHITEEELSVLNKNA